MRRINPRVREEVKHNRCTVINNTSTPNAGPELLKAIYKKMESKNADECVVNVLQFNKYAEVDLLKNGKVIAWGCPVFPVKE